MHRNGKYFVEKTLVAVELNHFSHDFVQIYTWCP